MPLLESSLIVHLNVLGGSHRKQGSVFQRTSCHLQIIYKRFEVKCLFCIKNFQLLNYVNPFFPLLGTLLLWTRFVNHLVFDYRNRIRTLKKRLHLNEEPVLSHDEDLDFTSGEEDIMDPIDFSFLTKNYHRDSDDETEDDDADRGFGGQGLAASV